MSPHLRAHELDLPLRQTTVTDMLTLLDDPTVDIRSIGQRIATEPVLAARLLTLANSPFYGRRNEVLDLPSAVMTVGQTSVRALVLALAVDAILSDDLGLGEHWWDDCLRVAATAGALASHLGADSGTAFCAGLLADIGQMAIAVSSPAAWAALRTAATTPDGDMDAAAELAAEVEQFGIDHAALGARILSDLGLPAALTDAVANHHDPRAMRAGGIDQAVFLAAEIVDGDRRGHELDTILAARELDGIDAVELRDQVDEQVATLRAAFSS